MSPALLPALLGVTLMLPRVQALTCQSGTLQSLTNVSALPLQWKNIGQEVCEDGWGCQDMLMIVENGPQLFLVLIKGCTPDDDHDVRITQHREGPGLSVISYTHVCRQENLCNNLLNTVPLWAPTPSTAEGSVRCPVCLSTEGCEAATEVSCPIGHTHCYNGVLQLRAETIDTNLRVQGCMSQAACDLLNQTQKMGPLSVSENCDTNAFPTCQQGIIYQIQKNLTLNPIEWKASRNVTCDFKEVCQETLLLIDVGPNSLIVGSKGCSKDQTEESQTVTIHSATPGVLVASYGHFCSSSHCNRANSSSVLLNSVPHPAVPDPGDMSCPVCVALRGTCIYYSEIIKCPKGTTYCYDGDIELQGRQVDTALSISACVPKPSSRLLNHGNNIGEFFALEIPEHENEDPLPEDRAAPGAYLAWVVGLGLSLALWYGMSSISP